MVFQSLVLQSGLKIVFYEEEQINKLISVNEQIMFGPKSDDRIGGAEASV